MTIAVATLDRGISAETTSAAPGIRALTMEELEWVAGGESAADAGDHTHDAVVNGSIIVGGAIGAAAAGELGALIGGFLGYAFGEFFAHWDPTNVSDPFDRKLGINQQQAKGG